MWCECNLTWGLGQRRVVQVSYEGDWKAGTEMVWNQPPSLPIPSNPDHSQAIRVSPNEMFNNGDEFTNWTSVDWVIFKFYKINHYIYGHLFIGIFFSIVKKKSTMFSTIWIFMYLHEKICTSRYIIKCQMVLKLIKIGNFNNNN